MRSAELGKRGDAMSNIFNEKREIKSPKLYQAMITFAGLIIVMFIGIKVFEVDPHIPMFIGVIFAAIMAMVLGYCWADIEKMMIDGISKAMQSILILAIVGMMIGVWLLSGTIPTMIYFGLKLLSPKVFLVAAVLICSITSLATGTSWGTMGTMGLALIGIGQGLGMPAGPTAGAVICGAYFGDKLSPLSDTTNLAPAMAGTDVFTHVKYMLKSTLVAYILALVFFRIYGFMHASGGDVDTSQATILMEGIKNAFNINPLLLLPPIVVILSIAFKVPAIPGITLGLLTAAVMAPIFQHGVTMGDILDASRNGFVFEAGPDSLNDLLSTGGLMNMSSSILMTVIAMMFGGIMEGSGQLSVMIESIGAVHFDPHPRPHVCAGLQGEGHTSEEPLERSRIRRNSNLVSGAVEYMRNVYYFYTRYSDSDICTVGDIQLYNASDMLYNGVHGDHCNEDDTGRAGQSRCGRACITSSGLSRLSGCRF